MDIDSLSVYVGPNVHARGRDPAQAGRQAALCRLPRLGPDVIDRLAAVLPGLREQAEWLAFAARRRGAVHRRSGRKAGVGAAARGWHRRHLGEVGADGRPDVVEAFCSYGRGTSVSRPARLPVTCSPPSPAPEDEGSPDLHDDVEGTSGFGADRAFSGPLRHGTGAAQARRHPGLPPQRRQPDPGRPGQVPAADRGRR